jgi:hypothetical protein
MVFLRLASAFLNGLYEEHPYHTTSFHHGHSHSTKGRVQMG